MAGEIGHVEVVGRDGAALRGFYSELVGWKFDEIEGMDYGMVYSGPPSVGVGTGPGDPSGHVTFYVAVDDLDGAVQRADALGGRTVVPPMEVPGGLRIALVADPEGHVVGLSQPTG
jgi:uncharacterized protein